MKRGVAVLNHDTGFRNMKKDLVRRYGKEAADRIWEKPEVIWKRCAVNMRIFPRL